MTKTILVETFNENNELESAIEYPSIISFCRQHNYPKTSVYDMINQKYIGGTYRTSELKSPMKRISIIHQRSNN